MCWGQTVKQLQEESELLLSYLLGQYLSMLFVWIILSQWEERKGKNKGQERERKDEYCGREEKRKRRRQGGKNDIFPGIGYNLVTGKKFIVGYKPVFWTLKGKFGTSER